MANSPVTLEEIDKREKELNEVEVQAQKAMRTNIPERRFGAGVTRETQQAAYRRREEGKRVLGEIKQQRTELKTLRGEVTEYNKRQAEIKKLEDKAAAYKAVQEIVDASVRKYGTQTFAASYARRAGEAFAQYGLSKKQGQWLYEETIRSEEAYKGRKKYLEEINKLKQEGLKPVYSDGKLTGFEDTIRKQSIGLNEVPNLPAADLARYERAGIIERRQATNIPTGEEGNFIKLPSSIPDRSDQIYSPQNKAYVKAPYGWGAGGTAIISPPTESERIKIEEAEYKNKLYGRAVLELPVYPVTGLKTPVGENQLKEWTKDFNVLSAFNYKKQFDLFKKSYDFREANKQGRLLNIEAEQVAAQYAGGKITEKQYYTRMNIISQDETWKKLEEFGAATSIQSQYIKGAPTGFKKDVLTFAISGSQVIPYINPYTRVLAGASAFSQGEYIAEDVTLDKYTRIMGGVQAGFGAGVAASGFVSLSSKGISIIGSPGQLRAFKIASYGSGVTLAAGFGVLEGVSVFSETGNLRSSITSGLGTSSAIGATMVYPSLKNKAMDYWRTRNTRIFQQPPLSRKPFIKTEGSEKRLVFYERAEELKLFKPSTWKYRGYKPGQFFKREYLLIDPAITARDMGLKEFSSYGIRGGKVAEITGKAANFPYDKPASHLSWFKGEAGGIKQYYLPKNIDIKGMEGLGFSATPEQWNTLKIGEAGQYFSGKGISARFLRLGSKYEDMIIWGGAGAEAKRPAVYAGYFEKVQVNPAIKEIKVPNPYGYGKPIKMYLFSESTKGNAINLPLMKMEVEGVKFGEQIPISKRFSFKYQGRTIPLIETTFKGEAGALGSQVLGGESQLYSYIPQSKIQGPTLVAYNVPTKSSEKISEISVPKQKAAEDLFFNVENIESKLSTIKMSESPLGSVKSQISSLSKMESPISSMPKSISELSEYNPMKSSAPPSSPKKSYPESSFPRLPNFPSRPTPPSKPTPILLPKFSFKGANKQQTTMGYKAFVIKGGKRVYLKGILPRGEALELGQTKALTTLRATFGVEKTGVKVKAGAVDFKVSKAFRPFKIKQGKRIKLQDTFIQKKGTRLSSRGEIKEIQIARGFKL